MLTGSICMCLCRRVVCRATINRYGFNSAGADAAASHLENFWVHAQRNPDIKPGAATASSSSRLEVPVSGAQTTHQPAPEAYSSKVASSCSMRYCLPQVVPAGVVLCQAAFAFLLCW
jgi:hypothetical protein